jgi:uncharacterized protein (DUF433 family)
MSEAKTYVRVDKHGVMRVSQKRVMLDGIVAAFWEGHSPEMIRQEYPALTLEEVYGAIAYYLANRDEVDRYMERQQQLWDELRRQVEQTPCPVVERLRALRKAAVPEGP